MAGVVLALTAPMEVKAAVSATVTTNDAKVHQQPSSTSPVIDTLPTGTLLRLGAASQGGWRRAAIPIGDQKGKIGWIEEANVSILDDAEGGGESTRQRRTSSRSAGGRTARLSAGAFAALYSAPSGTSGSSGVVTRLSFTGQGSFYLGPVFTLGLRGHLTSVDVVDSVGYIPGFVTFKKSSQISIALPIEANLISTPSLQFFLGLAPRVDLPPATGISVTKGGLGYAGGAFYLSKSFFLRLEAGYSLTLATAATDTLAEIPSSGAPFGGGMIGLDF